MLNLFFFFRKKAKRKKMNQRKVRSAVTTKERKSLMMVWTRILSVSKILTMLVIQSKGSDHLAHSCGQDDLTLFVRISALASKKRPNKKGTFYHYVIGSFYFDSLTLLF